MRADAGFLGGHVEARATVDTIAVHKCHGLHAELLAGAGQFLGDGSAFEETEAGAGVELDVGRGFRRVSGGGAFSHNYLLRTSRAARKGGGRARHRSMQYPIHRATMDRRSTNRPRYARGRPIPAYARGRLRLSHSSGVRHPPAPGRRAAAETGARRVARGSADVLAAGRVRIPPYERLAGGANPAVRATRHALPPQSS